MDLPKLFRILLTVLFLLSGFRPAMSQVNNFLFGGYMRSGFGLDGKGHPMDFFKAPNAEAKYRLGNEAEAYMETMFGYETSDDHKMHFGTYVRFAFVTPTSKSNAFTTTLTVREAYVRMGGFLPRQKTLTFWGGQRYYNRYDNHLNDFWYWDMSGFGGGVEDIALGNRVKLSVAMLGGSIDDLQSNGNVYPEDYFVLNKTTFDFYLHDISLLGGTVAFTFDVSRFTGDTVVTNEGPFSVESSYGWSAGMFYRYLFDNGGQNTFNIFYGSGAAENYKATMVQPLGLIINPGDRILISKMSRFRIMNDLRVDISEHFSLMALAEYQHLNNGMTSHNKLDWFSMGFRPIWHFSRYFSLVTEMGLDYTQQEGMLSGSLGKFTIAPQLSPQNRLLSRPALRAYFTWAVWSDDYVGMIAPHSFPDRNNGISVGIQMETWW